MAWARKLLQHTGSAQAAISLLVQTRQLQACAKGPQQLALHANSFTTEQIGKAAIMPHGHPAQMQDILNNSPKGEQIMLLSDTTCYDRRTGAACQHTVLIFFR